MCTLTKAILIATQAHDGQVDKGGNPYILHPLRLLINAHGKLEQIVAVLHDVIEDTNYTLNDMKLVGFSEEVIEALDCLTRRKDESYDDFIQRIKPNPLARSVKYLDLEDNSNLSRISCPTEKDFERMKKYKKAAK